MLEQILLHYEATNRDFLASRLPDDPSAAHGARRAEDYCMKAAVAATLQPQTILEIGVRDGDSYTAFKHGHPATQYLGIRLEENTSVGKNLARQWPCQFTQGTKDECVMGDLHGADRLPGAIYDLVQVHSQPNSPGGQRALELALAQGCYVFVDGYFQTRNGCLSVSDFLQCYRDVVAWASILPTHAGVLLIKVKPVHLERESRRRDGSPGGGSEALREQYTEDYYRKDCGGWEAFERHRAHRLDNMRLQSLFDLAMLTEPKRLLDLGCGRGEITYQAARRGVQVTAVDYSPAAIEIAKTCFEGEPELVKNVEWISGSAADLELQGEYDVVVAGDLVEHLSPVELDRMYTRVRRHLASAGRLIVHTFPNLWFYRYHHARQLRTASEIGAYLPVDPRSRYERLMHINEQSPRVLRRQLGQYFDHVLLWFLHLDAPAGNLARPMNRRELAGCRDLYAVASQEKIEAGDVSGILTMKPLSSEQARGVSWSVEHCPSQTTVGTTFSVSVAVQNRSGMTLQSRPPAPVHLSYHWYDAANRKIEVFDGQRSPFFPALPDGTDGKYETTVQAPARIGVFLLCLMLVQEGVRWFDEIQTIEVTMHRIGVSPTRKNGLKVL